MDASGPLFANLTDDWKQLNTLLVSGSYFPSSLKRVRIFIRMNSYDGVEEQRRWWREWDNLSKDIFRETHRKTGIVVKIVIS
jgi:hypothetical protein